MPVEGTSHILISGISHTRCAESGNMIIMALSYAQKTGDLSQLKTYVRDDRRVRWPQLTLGI